MKVLTGDSWHPDPACARGRRQVRQRAQRTGHAEEAINGAWAQVDVALQRRADLIPNLVETVKGFAAHETEVFKNIADARAALGGARTPPEKIAANDQLAGALSPPAGGHARTTRNCGPTRTSCACRTNWPARKIASPSSAASTTRRFSDTIRQSSCFPNNIVAAHERVHPQRCLFQDRARRSRPIPKVQF